MGLEKNDKGIYQNVLNSIYTFDVRDKGIMLEQADVCSMCHDWVVYTLSKDMDNDYLNKLPKVRRKIVYGQNVFGNIYNYITFNFYIPL